MTDLVQKKDGSWCPAHLPALLSHPAACHPDSAPPSPTETMVFSYPLHRSAVVTGLKPKAPPDSEDEIDLSLEREVQELREEIRTAATLALRSVENFTLKRLRSFPKTPPYSPIRARQSLDDMKGKVPKKRNLEEYRRKEQRYGPGRRGRSTSPIKRLASITPFTFLGDTSPSYVDFHVSVEGKQSKSLLVKRRKGKRTQSISDIPAPEPNTKPFHSRKLYFRPAE